MDLSALESDGKRVLSKLEAVDNHIRGQFVLD